MNSPSRYLFALCLLVLLSGGINAQSSDRRPRIGLTLSGGGAKGLAHIGILKAIDSAGLKIDYITGTSMGSIIGGLYAAGYAADSIEKMSHAIDWDLMLSNQSSLSSLLMEEKEEYGKQSDETRLTLLRPVAEHNDVDVTDAVAEFAATHAGRKIDSARAGVTAQQSEQNSQMSTIDRSVKPPRGSITGALHDNAAQGHAQIAGEASQHALLSIGPEAWIQDEKLAYVCHVRLLRTAGSVRGPLTQVHYI